MIFDMLKALLGDESEEAATEQKQAPTQPQPAEPSPRGPWEPPASGQWIDPLAAPYPWPQQRQAQREQPKKPSLLQRIFSRAPASRPSTGRQRPLQYPSQPFGAPMRARPVQRRQQSFPPQGRVARPYPYQQQVRQMTIDPFGAPVPRQPRHPRQPMGPWL